MRVAAAACAIAIVVFLAIFGAVLAQKATSSSTVAASTSAVRTPAATPELPPPAASVARPPSVAPPAMGSAPQFASPQPSAPAVASPPPQVTAQFPPATPASVPPAAATTSAPPPALAAPSAASVAPTPTCDNPNALGVARVVEIDTTGGPGFGFEHFKSHDFLRDHEVVLTFDDGPWPRNTPAVLAALAAQCVRATFFPIGKHATYHPEILRQVAAAGHAVGSHTWSHADLSKKSAQEAKDEIEKGFSAVRWALGGVPGAPYFRFPALKHPAEMVTYLGERNIAIFSTDMDSFDFKTKKPDQVVKNVMAKLKKFGKGIVLMHDFQHATADAAPALLAQLKAEGYKIVFMKPRGPVATIASYDATIFKDQKLPTISDRPTSNVVRTINE